MRNRFTVLVLVLLTITAGACGEPAAGDAVIDEPAAGSADGQVQSDTASDGSGEKEPETQAGSDDESSPDTDQSATPDTQISEGDGTVDQSGTVEAEPWFPKTIDELVDPLFVVDVGFGFGMPEGWYEQVWMKAADSQGEVVAGQGVRFTGRGGSTRSGIMTEVDFEVGDYTHIVVAINGVVLEQGLSGTGWHGREAPLAIAVTYVDEQGTQHTGLGEDPTSPTNMFYRGFTAIPEEGMFNGVEVSLGEPFVYQFDMMGLDPAPVHILAVGIEGGGWDPRVGEAAEFMLAAGH